jgi:tetratricopeptide (TPR) repeat protein
MMKTRATFALVMALLAACDAKKDDNGLPTLDGKDADALFVNPGYVAVQPSAAEIRSLHAALATIKAHAEVSPVPAADGNGTAWDKCQMNRAYCVSAILNMADADHPGPVATAVDAFAKTKPKKVQPSAEVQRLIAEGDTAMGQNQFDVAAQLYAEAVKQAPDYPELWSGYGAFLVRTSKLNDAVEAYVNAIGADASQSDAWLGLGLTYSIQGDRTKATSAMLTAYLVSRDKKHITDQLRQLRGDGNTRFARDIDKTLELADVFPGATSYPVLCPSTSTRETCPGASVHGVGLFKGIAKDTLYLGVGNEQYELSPAPQLQARAGQLVEFSASTGEEYGKFRKPKAKAVPFKGTPAQEMTMDAFNVVDICGRTALSTGLAPSEDTDAFRDVKDLKIDPANHGNATVIRTNTEGYIYRCAVRDWQVKALQGRPGKYGDNGSGWKQLGVLRHEMAMARDQVQRERERSEKGQAAADKAQLKRNLDDADIVAAVELNAASNHAAFAVSRADAGYYEMEKSNMSACQASVNSMLVTDDKEAKIGTIVRCARRMVEYCASTGAGCADDLRNIIDSNPALRRY